MSVGDIASQVDSYINTIATAIGEDSTELKIKFGFDDTDTLPLINNVTDKLQNEFVDRVGELRIDELQIAAGLEIPNATLLSWDELITKIKEVQNSTANENPISSTITSSSISVNVLRRSSSIELSTASSVNPSAVKISLYASPNFLNCGSSWVAICSMEEVMVDNGSSLFCIES